VFVSIRNVYVIVFYFLFLIELAELTVYKMRLPAALLDNVIQNHGMHQRLAKNIYA